MQIVFMGSAPFAVPSLIKLVESKHDIVTVITQPDKPAGRGRKITPCAVANKAAELDLQLYQPKSVKSSKVIGKIRDMNADIFIVVAYGKILPLELIDIPPLGCVNIHASLLPKYRGAAPINWAIVNGENVSGVTTMHITEELDAGDILLTHEVPIKEYYTSLVLHDILAESGADLLVETIEGLQAGTITPKPQDHSKATFAPLIEKDDGRIDWSKSAEEIHNLIRGMQPWPSAFTTLDGENLRIYESVVIEGSPSPQPSPHPPEADQSLAEQGEGETLPGPIVEASERLIIAAGQNRIEIRELQLQGKRRMTIRDFLNGHPIKQGNRLE